MNLKNIWIDSGYELWTQRRLAAIIDHYGAFFFQGKRIVDLGAGHGLIGGGLGVLGAKVVFVEGREEHLVELEARYPDCETRQINLDTDWPVGSFDLAIFMGCIYHLDDPVRAIHHCARYPFTVLETEVIDKYGSDAEPEAPGEGPGADQAIGEVKGKHPTTQWVERELLRNEMTAKRYMGSQCNAGNHRYDWMPTGEGHKSGMRALWFCQGASSC